MTSPTSFSLLGRNLKLDTAEDAQPHITQLHSSSNINHVQLGGNTIGQHASQAIAAALPKDSLTHFDAADIFTGRLISEIPLSLSAFSDALATFPLLQEINFSDNAFGGRCADSMTSLLAGNQSLATVRLQNNGLGVTGGKIIAAALDRRASSVQGGAQSNLKALYIGRNRLENGSAPDIARALAKHGPSIEEVAMPQNGIRMDGIQSICESLGQHCPNLRLLDLQDNTLVYKGSQALAFAIPRWSKLTTLNLSDTLLRSRGGILVFDALADLGSKSQLHTLQLQYCELNRKALEALANALEKGLPELKVLEVHGNWAEEEDECVERIRAEMERRGAGEGLSGLDELEPEAEEEEEDEEEEEEEEDGDEDDEKEETPAAKADDSLDGLTDALSSKMTFGGSTKD
ncbi:hypothetical protein CF327_g125 [Tilletia walkeri]|nr:hypothetical protein CF327_g125 [Tilletia walkeri]